MELIIEYHNYRIIDNCKLYLINYRCIKKTNVKNLTKKNLCQWDNLEIIFFFHRNLYCILVPIAHPITEFNGELSSELCEKLNLRRRRQCIAASTSSAKAPILLLLLLLLLFVHPLVFCAPCRTDPPRVRASKDKKKSNACREKVRGMERTREWVRKRRRMRGVVWPFESQCIFLWFPEGRHRPPSSPLSTTKPTGYCASGWDRWIQPQRACPREAWFILSLFESGRHNSGLFRRQLFTPPLRPRRTRYGDR